MSEREDAVQRMQDYIEKNLSEAITAGDLARTARYSPWYSARLFKELTGLSPAEYIRRLKLAESAMKLRDGDVRVIDAALDAGFGSVDGYQRAFYREFGVNPKEYSLKPVPIRLFTPYGVKFRQLWKKENEIMETVRSVFIQIIEKPARKAVVKRGVKAEEYWDYCNEVGCDVWGVLASMKSLCGEPVCLWLPEKLRAAGTSKYVQGVEVPEDFSGEIPEGFDIVSLPAAQYLMFQGEPFKEEEYCDAIGAVQSAMEKYEPACIGFAWDDSNPRIQLEPIGTRGYIELRAVKPAK